MKKTKILVFVLLVALCLSCFAACNKTPKELVDARDYLYNQYKEFDGKATPADFNRVGAVMINGTKYPIEWTVEVKTEGQSESVKVVKNEDGTVTVDVDEKAAVEISYDLTATISNAKGKTITVTFHHTVPQFKELTYAEYYATEAGKTVVVKGVITAIISKERGNTVNGFYMQDQDGGYYVYGMVSGQTPESLGLKVGMTVRAAGEKDIYNGTHEIKDAGVEILDETITAVTPADYTEIFTKAAKLSDEALTAKQSTVVTLKGVTVKENGGSDGSYYYFELAGKKSYVRISSSACPLTKDEITAFKAGFESSFGKVGNVTGIISLYDGSFYLTPISGTPFTDLQLPVLSDADAVAFEKGALTFMSLIGYDGSYDLAFQGSAYTDVAISWALDKEYAGVSIADNKLVVELQEEAQTIKLVATIKRGEATDTKEFEVAIDEATSQYLPVVAETVTAGKAYKLVLEHEKLGKTLYADGEMSGYYFQTVEKPTKGMDFYVEEVKDGETLKGYRLYYLKDEAKVYVEIVAVVNGEKTYINVKYQATATEGLLWSWNDTLKTFTMKANEVDYFLGTGKQKTFDTLSACKVAEADKNFVVHFCTLVEADFKAVVAETVTAGKAYKLVLVHEKLGKTLYADGEMSGYYFQTVEKPTKGMDFYVEEVKDGETLKGYRLYYLKDEAKVYVEIVAVVNGEKTYINVKYQATATEGLLWSWNDTLKTFTMKANEVDYFLGTGKQKTFDTLSACKVAEADKNFVVHLCTLELAELEIVVVENFDVNQGYKLELIHEKLGKTLYADGEMSGYYFQTVEKYAKGMDFYVEEVKDGETLKGYRLYYLKDEAKVYVEIVAVVNGEKTYINVKYQATATEGLLWSWNDTLKTFTMKANEVDYFLGTGKQKTFDTLSACKVAEADKNFVARFVLKQFKAETPVEKTDEEKLAEIKVPGTVEKDFDLDKNATWTVKSGEGIAISGTKATVTRGEEDSTVVITATIGEATKDFTIVVKAKIPDGVTVVTLKHSETSTTNMTGENDAARLGLDATVFTVISTKTGNNHVGLNKDGSMRMYKKGSCEMKISIAEGKEIVKITITLASDSPAKDTLVITKGTDAITGENGVYEINGNTVVIKNTSQDKQVYIASIEIQYR